MDYFDYVTSKTTNEHFKDPGVQEFMRCIMNQNKTERKGRESAERERDQYFAECMRLRCKLVKGVYTK